MKTKPNILVVCGRNKIRSKTAEHIFKNDERINIRSVGLSTTSNRKIKIKDIEWANLILVMENKHKSRIVNTYKNVEIPKIIVLEIGDEYKYLDKELCKILKSKIDDIIQSIDELSI
jgi:predicted protein tyrosine phosphatase